MAKEQFSQYSFLLDRTARRVKQYAQQKFKLEAFDITVDQWLVLRQLADGEQLSQTELAQRVSKDHPTLTRILDILEKKQLLLRQQHPSDRRSFQLMLTTEGEEKVRHLRPKIAEIRQQAWKNLTEQDFDEFKRILTTIYDNLNQENV
ncbi:MarR family transcriptional regulator [Nitritalea halalkaliphila LW7]|uniref:MarR family transcriptional regulator n=1 Tax=Nitritalea halalkaliphila LW7 TaxID=1189621 RepID=I5C4B8_9BACT|nr:MarR family transcriptional regulator [Nitritalea halalkaliphila]EIM76670.1 MarR family transcriptional regulator [Nitritalea halalkaliphila LW7]